MYIDVLLNSILHSPNGNVYSQILKNSVRI